VTENDWRALGTAAAASLQLPVARAAFSHLGDEAALALLQRVQEQWSAGAPHDICTAEVLACQVFASVPGPRLVSRPGSCHSESIVPSRQTSH
jgi:hypothetical protein